MLLVYSIDDENENEPTYIKYIRTFFTRKHTVANG